MCIDSPKGIGMVRKQTRGRQADRGPRPSSPVQAQNQRKSSRRATKAKTLVNTAGLIEFATANEPVAQEATVDGQPAAGEAGELLPSPVLGAWTTRARRWDDEPFDLLGATSRMMTLIWSGLLLTMMSSQSWSLTGRQTPVAERGEPAGGDMRTVN